MSPEPEEHVPVWLSVGDLPATNVGEVEDPTDHHQIAEVLRGVADEFERIARIP